MIIGIPKEWKDNEGRVGLTPDYVVLLVKEGHVVLVETGAGILSGFEDSAYEQAGAFVVSRREVWERSDTIVKVKEPLPEEYPFFRPGLIVMGFFHFAGNPQLERICKEKKILSICYEDIYSPDGKPILRAMSTIAGEEAVNIATHFLGAQGKTLRDVVTTVIGFGSAGQSVYSQLVKRHGKGFILDIVAKAFQDRNFRYWPSTPENIFCALEQSNLVIGAAVTPDGAPKIITREMIRKMPPKSLFIDISIDEGGISETSRPTSHTDPMYVEEGVTHYCVSNIPGKVPRRSTPALVKEIFPYIQKLARDEKRMGK